MTSAEPGAVVCTQPRTYALFRPDFLTAAFAAGKASGAKAMLPWSLVAWAVDASDSGGCDLHAHSLTFGHRVTSGLLGAVSFACD